MGDHCKKKTIRKPIVKESTRDGSNNFGWSRSSFTPFVGSDTVYSFPKNIEFNNTASKSREQSHKQHLKEGSWTGLPTFKILVSVIQKFYTFLKNLEYRQKKYN